MPSAGQASSFSGVTVSLQGQSCFWCVVEVKVVFAHLRAWWNPWFVEPLVASWTGGVRRLESGCSVAGILQW